jgi:hypothetical protein
MSQVDTVRQLVLDRSGADLSGAANYGVAVSDAAAQCARIDCDGVEYVDVTVKITNVGSGPMTKLLLVGRVSGAADPVVGTPADYSPVVTEDLNKSTGVATCVPYQIEMLVGAVGEFTFTFPVRQRYFAPIVWVDSATGTRGQVFVYRRVK